MDSFQKYKKTGRTGLVLALILFAGVIFAQKSDSQRPVNNLNLGLFGDASSISATYERLYFAKPNFFLGGKLGIGYNEDFLICIFGDCPKPEKYVTLPHHITCNMGKDRHFFEFGLGGTMALSNTHNTYLFYPLIGYRFLPMKSKKVNFRVFVLMPVTGFDSEDFLIMPFGVSAGISF